MESDTSDAAAAAVPRTDGGGPPPRPTVPRGDVGASLPPPHSYPFHTASLSDVAVRIVQVDYVLTSVRDVPRAMLAENPDVPLRQPIPGKPGKTRDTQVCYG